MPLILIRLWIFLLMKKWAVLASFWILIFSYGANWFSVAPLLKDLEEEYGIGGAESHLLLSIIGLFVIFFAWPAGDIVDKKGPRASAIIGSLFMVLGFAGRVWLNGNYFQLLFVTSIGGIGLAWILVALAPQMIQWFKDKSSLAIGLASSGLFVGFGTASFLSPYINQDYGINAVYKLFALLAILAFVIYLAFGKDKGVVRKEKARFLEGIKSVFSSRNAIIYPFIGFFIVGGTLSASALLPKLLEESGLGEVKGGNVIGVMLFGCALGAFAFPYVAHKYGVKKTTLTVAFLSLLFWMTFYLDLSFAIYLLIAFLFGIFLQSSWPVALHCQETEKGVNERNEGVAASLYISISNVGGAILPVIVGKLADASLENAFIAILAYVIAILLLWGMIKK